MAVSPTPGAFRRSGSRIASSRFSILSDDSILSDEPQISKVSHSVSQCHIAGISFIGFKEEETLAYAKSVGLDTIQDRDLLWVAQFGMDAPVSRELIRCPCNLLGKC